MELKNELTEKELELLNNIGIRIENKKYTIDETGEMIEKLDEIIKEQLDENDEFTPKALEYEKIQDKILEYEKKL